ncbi:tetratricopeptide repeat protein [bacterium]|nr:tetratricopeptide repeat protein [bacterium]
MIGRRHGAGLRINRSNVTKFDSTEGRSQGNLRSTSFFWNKVMPRKRSLKKVTKVLGEPTPEILAEFLKRYHAAYEEHYRAQHLATAESPAHQAAVEFAQNHRITGGAELLQAIVLSWQGQAGMALPLLENILTSIPPSLRGQAHHVRGFVLDDLKRYDEAITEYLNALRTPGYDTPGKAWNNLGIAYAVSRDYDRAIESYRTALDTPGYDTPGDAWNNLGLAYAAKQDYDRAIKCYRTALDTPGYDTPGNTWNSLGLAYAAKQDYERAIECYRTALDTPGYDTRGKAWNNLGLAYAAKQDYERAIECYRAALDTRGYNTPLLTKVNLSTALRKRSRLNEALMLIDQVLESPDTEDQLDRARYVKQLIEADLADIPPTAAQIALAQSPSSAADKDSPEERMREKLQGLEDKYTEYLQRENSGRNDTFSVLRGWSSAVTLLDGGKEGHWHGGGYFLKWQGRGIVIDPGFDFVDNFHDEGFHARELDAVLVSHNHADHNFDLRSLDDLRYEIYRRSTAPNKDGTRRPTLPKSFVVLDEDTAKAFGDDEVAHRGTPVKFTRYDHELKRWLKPDNTNLPLTIEHFPVEHGADVPHAMGMRLRLHRDDQPDFVIGYTGDTRYFEGLVEHLKKDTDKGVDLLIAHISQPDPREFNDEEFLKNVHLGYNGVTKLIRAVQPKLTLIGEFWAGLADLRVDLIHGLRRRTKTDAILPTGLGFHLRIPSLEVECTECRQPTPHGKLRIAPPTSPFGRLGFLCSRCMV